MLIRIGVSLLPLIAFAQAPPEVDQALRARVTEFLQYHVDGSFRKAYEMVADDTKDEYFNTGKVQLTGFQIGEIKYADDFTVASVTALMSRTVNVAGQDVPVTLPSTTTWKIENGKWVWYNVPSKGVGLTPMGASTPADPGKQNTPAAVALPKDAAAIDAAARSILEQVRVDKTAVTLAANRASEDRVVFHNGMPGSVKLELVVNEVPGFSAKLEKSQVGSGGDADLILRYEPGGVALPQGPVSVKLIVQPLNRVFRIDVKFAQAAGR